MDWMIYGANVYSIAVAVSLAVAELLLRNTVEGVGYTPSKLCGSHLVESLPGSANILIP